MVKMGAELMANGDVSAARVLYQRAADAGEPTAAFALAESYDPLVLGKGGIPPDLGLAQRWYAKAKDLGSTQAPERLRRLGAALAAGQQVPVSAPPVQ
jgi:TPR repeat protein